MDFNKQQKNNDLVMLINDSFLTEDEKQTLLKLYERDGASAEFLKKFEDALVDRFKLKTKMAVELGGKVGGDFAKIEKNYKIQRGVLMEKLQKELAQIEPTNVTVRTKLWDEHYDKIDELQNDIAALIKKISQNVLIEFAG
jgi:polyhydroxyalkanoate synthesis regulator phasin